MLSSDEVSDVVSDLRRRHELEMLDHDRAYDYVRGNRGRPSVPDGAGDELDDIAKMSVKNVMSVVVAAFAQNLSVNGFRTRESEDDEPVWNLWQGQRLDARQAEVHRSALIYGSGYAVLNQDGQVRLRTPRQLLAVYADPSVDEWPVYALETWVDDSGDKPERRGVLYDSEATHSFSLGFVTRISGTEKSSERIRRAFNVSDVESDEHDYGVPPVVRFINARDAEDVVTGEVTPLIPKQRAINAVNFDRLVVSRYGAFPQRYVIGWAPSGAEELVRASMARLMSFEDAEARAGAFPAASVEPYNSLLEEMVTDVAMEAQIPLSSFGRMANLSADALAMAEAPHQRKLVEKRESFGESWEQLLRLMGQREGVTVADDAEVTWRDTEARSFAQVVDGITKLAASGVPIDEMLTDIPGWSKQRVDSALASMRRDAGRSIVSAIGEAPNTTTGDSPEQMRVKFDALGVAIRAGVEPASAAALLGLEGIDFTGAFPTSLRLPEADAAKLEQA